MKRPKDRLVMYLSCHDGGCRVLSFKIRSFTSKSRIHIGDDLTASACPSTKFFPDSSFLDCAADFSQG